MFYNTPINEQPFLIRFRGILTRLFSKVHHPTTFNKTCSHLNLFEIVFSQLSSRYSIQNFVSTTFRIQNVCLASLTSPEGLSDDVDCVSILLSLERRIYIYFKSHLKPLCRKIIVLWTYCKQATFYEIIQSSKLSDTNSTFSFGRKKQKRELFYKLYVLHERIAYPTAF